MTLAEIANHIVGPQKGVLAADESSPPIKKRFDSINVESTATVLPLSSFFSCRLMLLGTSTLTRTC